MIGQIAPLVRGNSSKLQICSWHVSGGLLGGLVGGVILGWFAVLASALGGSAWTSIRPLLLGSLLLLGAASDLDIIRYRLLRSLNRQTPRAWNCALGGPGAALAWGSDLALVVTTRISYQGMLAVIAATILAPGYWTALFTMATFGTVRAMATVTYATRTVDIEETTAQIDARFLIFKRAVGASALTVALVQLLPQLARLG